MLYVSFFFIKQPMVKCCSLQYQVVGQYLQKQALELAHKKDTGAILCEKKQTSMYFTT